MAENRRVRVEPHIESYLLTHAERVLHKPAEQVTTQDMTTLVNALLYEHKLAQGLAQQVSFGQIFNWLSHVVSAQGTGSYRQHPPAMPAKSVLRTTNGLALPRFAVPGSRLNRQRPCRQALRALPTPPER